MESMSSRDGERYGRCAASQAAASRLHRTEADSFIQAAHPISLQVDRDVLIANAGELANDPFADIRLERARQFVAADFESSKPIVMAHAADAETEGAERFFGALDHAQLFIGHFRVIWNTRRQARGRRLVPRRQPGAARELANVVLGQADFVERAANAELLGRFPAGPVIAAI